MTQTHGVTETTVVKLHGSGEFIEAIPGLLGYVPSDSIVLVGIGHDRRRVGKCVRTDLPPPEHISGLADAVADAMTVDEPSAISMVVVGGGTVDSDGLPPHADLIAAVCRRLGERGVPGVSAHWVASFNAGAPWCSYADDEHGELPDPGCSALVAELASVGRVTFGSRAEVEALFQPDADELVAERERLLEAKLDDLADWTLEKRVETVRAALRSATTGLLALNDDQVAGLAIALAHKKVRDACLATAWPADRPLARAAERLWQALTRALPVPERAEAACLAGYAAYVQGDGTTAQIALETALAADPKHTLAGLAHAALINHVHPREVRSMARYDLVGLCDGLGEAA